MIQNYQTKKAKAICKYAIKRAEYFKNHFKDHDLNDVWNLPTSNKQKMMKCLSAYNTLGFDKKDLINFCLEVEKSRDFKQKFCGVNVGMSSGTSGNKGVEITTAREERYLRALFLSRFDFPKGEKINLAFILRVSSPAFKIDKFGHRLSYISQLDTIENIVNKLNSQKPNVLSAPPSMLKILAEEKIKGKLKIDPKRIISYAEVLYSDVKKYLKKAFKCSIHEIYKCTEGAIAMTCHHEELHINEDLVAVQLYDEEGGPTPDGQPCHKMVVTDLHKTSQPIIRYELNDIITISKKRCKCGSSFRVIEKIQGRSDDIFWAPKISNNKLQFIFPDYISRSIITSSEDILEYQAIQKEPTKVLVRILSKKKANKELISKKVKNNLEEMFNLHKCQKPNIEIVFEEPKINHKSKKLIRIIRNFKK